MGKTWLDVTFRKNLSKRGRKFFEICPGFLVDFNLYNAIFNKNNYFYRLKLVSVFKRSRVYQQKHGVTEHYVSLRYLTADQNRFPTLSEVTRLGEYTKFSFFFRIKPDTAITECAKILLSKNLAAFWTNDFDQKYDCYVPWKQLLSKSNTHLQISVYFIRNLL